jgi:hypothetical protein
MYVDDIFNDVENILRSTNSETLLLIRESFERFKKKLPADVFSFDELSDWADENGYKRDESEYK